MNEQICADADTSTNASANFLHVRGWTCDTTLLVAVDVDGRTLKCPFKVVSCTMHGVMRVLNER